LPYIDLATKNNPVFSSAGRPGYLVEYSVVTLRLFVSFP
jgi:hypothetical protein